MALKFNPATGQYEEDMLDQSASPIDSTTSLMPQSNPPQQPSMDPMVKDYLMKKFYFGKYNDEARNKLVEDSKLGLGDKAGAALAAIGAGFMGKDAGAAGQAKLAAAKADKKAALDAFDTGRKGVIEQFDLDRKAIIASREDETLKREMDPNSAESKMAQDLAIQMGMNPEQAKGLTAAKFKDFSPVMQKKYEIAERALDRQERSKDRALQREIALGQRDQARQDKLEKEAKPSEKQVKEFTEFDNALDSIKSIRAQKSSQDTGPLSALQSNVAQFVGMDDSEKSAFKSEVQDQLAQYIKSISGGAVSDQERASLMQNIPKMSDNDETFNKKLDALEARLERNRQNAVTNAQKMGKNVKEFERAPSQPKASTKIRVSNGKETLEIDESDLSDAEADGYKRI